MLYLVFGMGQNILHKVYGNIEDTERMILWRCGYQPMFFWMFFVLLETEQACN
jgi:hypothetical protein